MLSADQGILIPAGGESGSYLRGPNARRLIFGFGGTGTLYKILRRI